MNITRTAIVDDDLSGTTGTVLDNAWKQELYGQIDAANSTPSASPTTTGNITSLSLPTNIGNGPGIIFMNNASLATIQGIAAGVVGQILTIVSIGAGQVDLSHLDAAAAAGTKLLNYATSGKTSLYQGVGSAQVVYDSSSRWRLINHDQGAWITPTYAGGNYTGSGGWTVDSGDVSTQAYLLRGRTLTVAWYLGTTTVVAGTTLSIGNGAWGGFTIAKSMLNPAGMNEAGGGNAICLANVTAAGTTIALLKQAGANFTAATNTSSFYGEITFEVQ